MLLVGVAAPLTAQDLPSVPQTLSLQDAVDIALNNNPTYLQTRNDGAPASWAVRNAFASWLPSVTANSRIAYQGSGEQRFLATEFRTSPTIGSGYGLNVNWQFNGRTLMEPSRQGAARAAVTASIDASAMTTRNQVVQQYVAVLEAEAQVGLQERQVTRDEENLRLAQARYEVGQTTMLDVRQAQVAQGRSNVARLQARQTLNVEKLRLFQQMGVEAPSDLSVVALSDSFPVVEPIFTLDDLLNQADMNNPDVAQLRAQETSAEWNSRAAKTDWLPSVSVNASWSGFTQQFTDVEPQILQAETSAMNNVASCQQQNQIYVSAGLDPRNCTEFEFTAADEAGIRAANSVFPFNFTSQPFNASLSVSFPIFNQFQRNLNNSQLSAAAADASEARRARELQVRTDVSEQYYAVLAAYESIQIQETNRVAAQEQLRLAREQYRVGANTFFNLLDAQVVAQQAAAEYITAFFSYHRSMANLEAAVGRSLR
jgi:outer membrane protein